MTGDARVRAKLGSGADGQLIPSLSSKSSASFDDASHSLVGAGDPEGMKR